MLRTMTTWGQLGNGEVGLEEWMGWGSGGVWEGNDEETPGDSDMQMVEDERYN